MFVRGWRCRRRESADNYRQRIGIYEKWIAESKYAGYVREIGESIPDSVSVNMDFVQAETGGKK
jgi:hypothetical protein